MEVKPGWKKEKRSSLTERNVTEVVYTFTKEDGSLWQIVADHRGTVIKGMSPELTTDTQLEYFAWCLSDAMREFLKLKRGRIVTPPAMFADREIPGN